MSKERVLTDEQVEWAYNEFKSGRKQKDIANDLYVCDRTLRREFKKIKSTEDEPTMSEKYYIKPNSIKVNAVEFLQKELKSCKTRLENAIRRNAPAIDIENIYKKIKCYERILKWVSELKITRQYIHENNLEYDLLAYSKRGSE